MDKYRDFLLARRKLIVTAINNLMDEISQGTPASVARKMSASELIETGESQFVEFKSSLRWDYKTKMVNQVLSYAVMKVLDCFLNSQGGTLLIGVDDSRNILGIENDLNTFASPKNNQGGFEEYLVSLFNSYFDSKAVTFLHWSFPEVRGGKLVRIDAEGSTQPIYLNHNGTTEFHVKVGNTCQPLDHEATVEYVKSHFPR